MGENLMIIMWLLSGVSCALARRTSIACSKKCRIISSTRSRKVEINLLMMIQGFYSLRILRGNKDIYRILHSGMKIWFLFLSGEKIFYKQAQQVSKNCFCHKKIKFISSSHRVTFFSLYRQKDIDNIIDFYSPKRKRPTNFEGKLPKLRHR